MYSQVEPADLVKYGLIPELVGRLPVIAALQELDEEALIAILTKPKNAIVRQYQALLGMEDVELEFTPDALKAVAEKAIARKTAPEACAPSSRACFLMPCSTFRRVETSRGRALRVRRSRRAHPLSSSSATDETDLHTT